ncbi:hypothetical protein GUITHDRAFT_116190 [Guillardia theta CCMP2712]|uniref:Uncharacterized protein n=2 Tax=Guillardia theta TaxID=55529 RepID=L1IN71_GUITC|nr:hypothetical protein GUITHDRAFT_116190 [Guillardia theta CCMP2712]EKX37713.1 hypothetical protein GUITHDRAFT_116190 [Guillardia theta CCMP2712]|eukprot:XP_005824693.1 hypothetical protein GUITHDRAFT_116190 [Guillardia theta CCMP2712]
METGCSVMEDPEQLVLKDMKEAEDGVQTELEHAESSNSRPVADMSDEYRCAMAGRGARDVFKDDDDEEEGGFFLTGTDMEEIVQKEANGDKSEEDHEEAVGGNVRIEAVEEADEREEGGGEQEVAEDEEGEESPSQRFRRMDGVEEEKAREDEEDEDEDQDGDIEFVDSEVRRRFRNIILQRGVEETGEETTAMEPRGDEGTQLGKTQAQDADLMEEEEEEEETAGEERYEENKAMQEELEVRRSRVESIHGELEEYVSYLHSKKLEEEDEPLVTFPDNYAEVLADEEAKVIESQEGFATARGDGLGSSGEHAASSIAESEEEEQVNKAREKMRRLDKLLGDKLRASRRIRLEGEASASAARILAKSEDERGAHVRADSRDTQLEGRPRSSAAAVKRALSSRERGGGELEKLTAKYGSRLGLTEEQDKRVV